ncbi:MAG: hypothetical protein IT233_09935 [Bacteroidia bacterium]|nr:hypothetical protein [Bacteroidia bacterium]
MKFRCFYWFLLVLALGSCKKDDQQSTPPEINFLEPADNTVYNVFDTIHIKFEISDNDRIASVAVSLLDASNVVAMPAVNVNPAGNPATITLDYILSDIHLASGYYYIKVYASDGSAGTYKLRQIYINEAPLVLLNPYFVSMPNPNTRELYKIDTLQNIVPCGTFSGDLLEMEISSWYGDLYFGGHYTGSTQAIELDDNSVSWTISPVVSSNPYFTDIMVSGKYLYVSFYDGRIRGYTNSGNVMYNSIAAPNWTVRRIGTHTGNYIVADIKELTSAFRKIILFNGSTGAGIQETYMYQDVVAFYSKDNNDIFCFGNDAGQGKMEIYQVSTNGFWTPYPVPSGSINSVARVDAGTYLIAHSNGNIYKYTYSNNSFLPHVPGVNASKVLYDPAGQYIFTIEGNLIRRYNYQTGALINTITHSAPVTDLELRYNK